VGLLDNDGFVDGLAVSAVILGPLLVGLLVLRRWTGAVPVLRRWTGAVLPVGGAAATGVALLALARADALPGRLALGVVLAGFGGLLGAAIPRFLLLRSVLVAPGVVLAVTTYEHQATWMTVAAVGGAATMGPAADEVDRRFRRTGLGIAMLCVTVAGVFVTIPETDTIAPVFGAMVPVGLLAVPWPVAWLGPGGASAMLALLAALTVDGGAVRDGAVVGGVLAPGLLALLVVLQEPPDAAVDRPWPPLARHLVALQIVVTLGVTRIAGLQESAWLALAIAVAVLAVGLVVARLVLARSWRTASYPMGPSPV
jgi:hypothetical protein